VNKSYAVIPARGGSKRIPNKNIQEINGMPLISFPITAALGSQEFADVFVSTDSKEIAEISVAHGASVPFIRDSTLSDDLTPTIPVVRDAISRIASLADEDIICCIYPTSIFVSAKLLRAASLLSAKLGPDNFLVSYTSFPYPIQRALRRDVHGLLNFVAPENSNTRSQDLEPSFHDAAQFYFARKSAWLNQDSVFKNALGFEISRKHVQDIDTWEDLENAKFILSVYGQY
jgi:pseudaminic acid cytidylyltransferase